MEMIRKERIVRHGISDVDSSGGGGALAVAVELEDVDVVGETVQQRTGQQLGAKDAGPLLEGQIAGDHPAAALVTLTERIEEQLSTGEA